MLLVRPRVTPDLYCVPTSTPSTLQDTTAAVFERIGLPLIERCFEGFNATLLTYGQTSSGKTFTIFGNNEQPGMIIHSINHVLGAAVMATGSNNRLAVRVTIVEIYNETISDLLVTPEFQAQKGRRGSMALSGRTRAGSRWILPLPSPSFLAILLPISP